MTSVNQTPAASSAPPPALPRVERLIVLAALALVVALAWLYLVYFGKSMSMSGIASIETSQPAAIDAPMPMDDMPGVKMAGMSSADAAPMAMAPLSFGLLTAMWIVMMIGMMLPSASPMVLMAARIGRMRVDGGGPAFGTGAFAFGYVVAWAGFALAAAAAQVGLQQGVLSGHDVAIGNGPIAGGVLIAAGLYQWTPFKNICLAKCRSPVGFFFSHWRPGTLGALRMGVSHGLYCLGCCWLLMALLFVSGVMALPWVAALAVLVLLEKVAPKGLWIARAGGAAMQGIGIYLIVAA